MYEYSQCEKGPWKPQPYMAPFKKAFEINARSCTKNVIVFLLSVVLLVSSWKKMVLLEALLKWFIE